MTVQSGTITLNRLIGSWSGTRVAICRAVDRFNCQLAVINEKTIAFLGRRAISAQSKYIVQGAARPAVIRLQEI